MGPAILIIVLLIALPVSLMVIGAVVAAALGGTLKKDVDDEFEGTEHLTLGG